MKITREWKADGSNAPNEITPRQWELMLSTARECERARSNAFFYPFRVGATLTD